MKMIGKRSIPLALMVFTIVCSAQRQATEDDPVHFVDPFIGTGGSGNTFPGAVWPWGMVSVSPHNALHAPSGYVHGREWFYGLGHVHLSGTGCAELGSIVITALRGGVRTQPEEYKCTIASEAASPGRYGATLEEPQVRVEATATRRTGITRFTVLKDGTLFFLIDAGRNLSLLGGGAARFTHDTEVEGHNRGGGFCGEANRHRVYYVARIGVSPEDRGTWVGDSLSSSYSAEATDTGVGAWIRVTLQAGDHVEFRVGISYVSAANARLNLEAETDGKDFELLREEASREWNRELGRIRVEGGTDIDRTRFFTALYHALLHPNIVSDVNGEFLTLGTRSKSCYADRERYSVFSLWDTYRTVHPLLTLAYPGRQSEMVATMLDMYRESGWLPKWELLGNETYMMVGDPAVPVIADTYLKGIADFDTLLAFEAIKKAATRYGPEAEPARPGYLDALRLGYIPVDQDTTLNWWVWGPVSTLLEYCLADWTISQVARRMGSRWEEEEFERRSLLYANLFDTETGFLRPRRRDRSWLDPFDPLQVEGSGNWSGSGGPGYVEGNAWHYRWFVPHDVTGLANLFGDAASCVQQLEECFVRGHFDISNEPDIAYPYLFTYFPGHEQKTPTFVRSIMDHHFTADPDGVPGNDDAGTISAWFVFSALGFYPACPGSGEYRLGVPLFDRIRLQLDSDYYDGREVIIDRVGSSPPSGETISVSWNGTPLPTPALTHGLLSSGGRLLFRLSEE